MSLSGGQTADHAVAVDLAVTDGLFDHRHDSVATGDLLIRRRRADSRHTSRRVPLVGDRPSGRPNEVRRLGYRRWRPGRPRFGVPRLGGGHLGHDRFASSIRTARSWSTREDPDRGRELDMRSLQDGFGAAAFAPDGSFYVLDVGNHRVQHFDTDRALLGPWGGRGNDAGHYNHPLGIAVDTSGVVYVLDDRRDVVERYDQTGKVLGSFSPGLVPSSSNGMALDAQGDIYVRRAARW